MTQLSRFQNSLSKTDAKCAIVSAQTNIRYICGMDYSDGYLLIFDDEAYLFTDFRYGEIAQKECSDRFKVCVPDNMYEEMYNTLKKHDAAQVLIEEDELTVSGHKRFADKFVGIEVVPGASKILCAQRMIKLPDEIEKIKKAQSITDAAFSHILGYLSYDVTEKDVATELEFFMRRAGAEGNAFETIAVNAASSSLPHGVPAEKKLVRGLLTMDFGAKFDGYCSDMTRTVCIGKATDEEKHIYNTVLAAQLAALEQVHLGMKCSDADAVARKIIADAGYGNNFGHSLGHGVGMYIHEQPSLAPRAKDESVLEVGHVVTVEPGIYLEGKFGCRIEDMIAVTDDGIEDLTHSTKEFIEI